jgi:2'-5' RNA ligase
MRLFVAVHVPEELKARAAALAKELPQDAITPVRPESMHLTLRFIGETDEKGRDEIIRKLTAIRFAPFRCSVKGTGVFPDENYVRVVWAGIDSNGALEALAKDVIGTLAGIGRDEGRGFTAHLTIARVRRKIDAAPFLQKHRDDAFGEFDVSGFALMESVLGGAAGPVYKKLAEFKSEG